MNRRLCIALGVLLSVCVSGCGEDAGGRHPVSGSVTMGGSSLKSGTIDFIAIDGSHQTGTLITDGQYSLGGSKGLLPGKYKVSVSSVSESGSVSTTEPPGPEAEAIKEANKETIPAKFNIQTELTYEAGPGKPSKFDVTIP